MVGTSRTLVYHWQDQEYRITLHQEHAAWHIQINEQEPEQVTCLFGNGHEMILRRAQSQVRMYIQVQPAQIQVALKGHVYHLQKRLPLDIESAAHGSETVHTQKTITAPMAGTLIKMLVNDGDIVEANQVLAILSAMKMEHSITAPYAGKVQKVHYPEGAVVPGGATIVEME